MTTQASHLPRNGSRDGIFLAADPRMLEIRELSQRVAVTNAPVLIVGESGVGKEVLARFIHAESERASRPFLKINCAAVPHELLESELFGHERGAFTGAHQRKEGMFEAAHGGTLLLDEIGEMSLPLQAKLLHVLEDWTFNRVGSTHPIQVDTRIIATTNKPLEEAITSGEFRKDLYFRLKVVRIAIPPLRERRDDIPLLCELFQRTCEGQGDTPSRIPSRLLNAFMDYHWPGNVRELKHAIQRYAILPDVEMVLSELIDEERAAPQPVFEMDENRIDLSVETGELVKGKISLKPIAARAAELAEKAVILRVLRETRWNRRRAAARMDICYKTLLNKLHHWQLDGEEFENAVRAVGTTPKAPVLVSSAFDGGRRPSGPMPVPDPTERAI
jgi:two-component system, NtrC family, response regulator AtoC